MGTWGAGNFDDDDALDFLASDVLAPLTQSIERELRAHDEGNGSAIMAALEVLRLLCEQSPAVPPKFEQVAEWRRTYLEAWDGYIDDLEPKPDYKIARRKTIEATFERLAVLAEKYWCKKRGIE